MATGCKDAPWFRLTIVASLLSRLPDASLEFRARPGLFPVGVGRALHFVVHSGRRTPRANTLNPTTSPRKPATKEHVRRKGPTIRFRS